MTFKQKALFFLILLLPAFASAQSISPAQVEQFKSLPKAQQEALARQYGVDLGALNGGASSSSVNGQAVRNPEPVVIPVAAAKEVPVKASNSDSGLQPFGYDLFAGSPTTFAPVTAIPVPGEYSIGPGDEIRLQLWGNQNQQLSLTVGRDGTINLPDIGPEPVAGMTFAELKERINKLVNDHFMGVKASVSMGELRSMQVFVLGEARNPGAYTVSSLSTVTNALFFSGGVSKTGSLRRIQLKRNGRIVSELDLYDLLLKGDSSKDNRMQSGDVIFIPSVGQRAGIEGEVYRPALYELKGERSLQELVGLAGGLTPQAYPRLTRIERTNKDFLRMIAEADLSTSQGKNAVLQAGDLVTVASISDITGQYVELQGTATRTGRFAWMPGMRVSSIIKSIDNDLLPVADKQYAAIVRTNPADDSISVLNLRLREAVQNPGSTEDLLLEEKDRLLFFADSGKVDLKDENGKRESTASGATRESLFAPVLQRLKSQAKPGTPQQTIYVTGPVRYPGEYPLPATRRLADAIFVAGGLKDSASLFHAEIARYRTNEDGVGQTEILTADLAGIMADRSDMHLQSRDRILVKSIPEFATRRVITLGGEVRYPGQYTFRNGETLREVIQRAGGLTDNAFPTGAVFSREKLRQLEAQRLREAEERLHGDLLGVQLEGDGFSGQSAERTQKVEDLLKDVQRTRPLGRMVIDLAAVLGDDSYQSIRLQDGDQLTVPSIPQSVSVFGEVQFPTSHLHARGLTVNDYLERSGGPTRQADESRVYVVKANGSVMLPQKSRWFGGRSQQLAIGDTIIVPIDVDRLNQLELWTNVSQIVYQMALGAAAVGNL